jgi:hypothetical protein
MKISGCSRWNGRSAFYEQTNNPTEHILKCLLPKGISALETCGPTAGLNCLTSLGHKVEILAPGGFPLQPEEDLSDWFNDERNFSRMKATWYGLDPGKLPGNEVVEWYPLAIMKMFGQKCTLEMQLDDQKAIQELRMGHALQAAAAASCTVYALMETTKLNGLEPWAYLKELLERLPAVRQSGNWESLLPWNMAHG